MICIQSALLTLARLLRSFFSFFARSFSWNFIHNSYTTAPFFTLVRKKPTWHFYVFGGCFFSLLPHFFLITEEFISIKLDYSIHGLINDIASTNPKFTDYISWLPIIVHCIYCAAFTLHVPRTYENPFTVQRLDFDLQL